MQKPRDGCLPCYVPWWVRESMKASGAVVAIVGGKQHTAAVSLFCGGASHVKLAQVSLVILLHMCVVMCVDMW